VKLLYSLLMNFLTPFIAPLFLLRARGRERLLERFGFWRLNAKGILWFHAASVGEVNGILPLIKQIRVRYPDAEVLLTSTSTTGLRQAEGEVDHLRLLPFDGTIWIRRALRDVKVSRFFFGETELWPNLLTALHRQGVPIHMVNGVISDLTYRRYLFFSKLFKQPLAAVNTFSMSNRDSATRVVELGAAAGKVSLTGNTKYDRAPTIQSKSQREALRSSMALSSLPTLVLASIHPTELEPWLTGALLSLKEGAKFQVVLAPRHREKVQYFISQLRANRIEFQLRSEQLSGSIDKNSVAIKLIVLDTMGELEQTFSLASMAFIGGTLCPIGGHNPLEAASYGCAICVGKHTFKIGDLIADLKRHDAINVVDSSSDIRDLIELWQSDPVKFEAQGARAKEVSNTHVGATSRVMQQIFSEQG